MLRHACDAVSAIHPSLEQGRAVECPRRQMPSLLFDFRHGARPLLKTPVFTVVTILTLAIGIGSTSATFSLVNAALLRPLGFHDPDRLFIVWEGFPRAGSAKVPAATPDYLDLVREQRSFTALAAHRCDTIELGGPGDPQRIDITRASAELFPLLGAEPLIGRVFTRAEDVPGHDVVVLSHRLWQRVFAGRQTVVGETVHLDRRPFIVIGVMPASFEFPRRGPAFNSAPAEAWIRLRSRPLTKRRAAAALSTTSSAA
jgi:putative ABC transport system permease protein